MHTIEFLAGTSIDKAAQELVEAANLHKVASGNFNGVPLFAAWGADPKKIVELYRTEAERRAKAYAESPEGQQAERERDQRRSNAQQTHDALMARLPSLDMRDDVAVLDWLCQMQGPSDHVGVIVRKKTIIEAFEKAGFRANANCGADYKPGDRLNMHRYLVGQALAGLKEGPAIHGIIQEFADEWRRAFVSGAQ